MRDHFFPLLFPKDSESLKILVIGLREMGAKRRFNGTSKVNRRTDKQTDKQTDISTYRKQRPRGPMLWKCLKLQCTYFWGYLIRGNRGHGGTDTHSNRQTFRLIDFFLVQWSEKTFLTFNWGFHISTMCDISWRLEIFGARQSLCKRGRGMSPILFLFFSNTLNVNGCEPTWAAMVSCGRRPLEMAETEAGSALCRDWFWKDLDCLTCKLDGVGSIDNRPSNN